MKGRHLDRKNKSTNTYSSVLIESKISKYLGSAAAELLTFTNVSNEGLWDLVELLPIMQ